VPDQNYLRLYVCKNLPEVYENKFYRKQQIVRWKYIFILTLILLTWRIWWAPNNASKWHMGFNSAFKGLIMIIPQNNYWNKLRFQIAILQFDLMEYDRLFNSLKFRYNISVPNKLLAFYQNAILVVLNILTVSWRHRKNYFVPHNKNEDDENNKILQAHNPQVLPLTFR
jgi:hypothetical protein